MLIISSAIKPDVTSSRSLTSWAWRWMIAKCKTLEQKYSGKNQLDCSWKEKKKDSQGRIRLTDCIWLSYLVFFGPQVSRIYETSCIQGGEALLPTYFQYLPALWSLGAFSLDPWGVKEPGLRDREPMFKSQLCLCALHFLLWLFPDLPRHTGDVCKMAALGSVQKSVDISRSSATSSRIQCGGFLRSS